MGDKGATGVPGAESNAPTASGPDGGAPEGTMRESRTRNFEVDHIVEKHLLTSGTLRRLTVAVVVDGKGKDGQRSPEEMARLSALVRSAVGADDRRGDVVTVELVPFLEVEQAPVVVEKPIVPERFSRYVPFAVAGAGAAVLLAFVIILVRARKRSRVRAAAKAAEAKAMVVAAKVEAEPIRVEKLDPEELRTRAHELAADDPATAALVLRFWLGEGNHDRDASNATNGGAHLA